MTVTSGVREPVEWLPVTIGVLASVGVGVFFYFRTELNAAFATFAGLLGTTVALQLEVLLQVRRQSRRQEGRLDLLHRLEATPWLMSSVHDTLAAISSIERDFPGGPAISLARRTLDACTAQLQDLQRGHYFTPFADNWLIHALTEATQDELLATSADEIAWWVSPSGRAYWRLQVTAMNRRAIRIERIFIYDTWTDQHEDVAAEQHQAGVRTMRVRYADVPPRLRQDMILWDGESGYQADLSSMGDRLNNKCTFAPLDVKRMSESYESIRLLAEPWPSAPLQESKPAR